MDQLISHSLPAPPDPACHDVVLLVDDDPLNCRILSGVLERAGYEVAVVHGPLDALSWIAASVVPPKLIVLDVMMPKMTGTDLARTLRSRPETQETPIILLTASSLSTHIEDGIDSGADDYLTKPINPKLLVARVKAAIRARVASREMDALAREMEEAARVQRAELPSAPLRWPGWRATGAVLPCGSVGGDVFDLGVGRGVNRTAVLVDVSGHGTAAALVASRISGELRLLLRTLSPVEALIRLNQQMCQRASTKYACLAVVEVDGNDVTIVNAGLPPVCLIRGDRIVSAVAEGGLPPGLLEEAEYQGWTFATEPGDRLVILSDGLTEPFGDAADVLPCVRDLGLLTRAPRQTEDLSPADLERGIRALFVQVSMAQPDDATLVLLERVR